MAISKAREIACTKFERKRTAFGLALTSSIILQTAINAADTLLSELAEEARRYLDILKKLDGELSLEEREDLEAELYASVSHFKSHSEITLQCLDDITDQLPEDEEVPT